ncbi:ADP-heptose--LPS heptosyltransferase I [Saccharobesus litoralis]|uniref:ADP-heptose--LPS heptosyltransferase I n=1 Tax=Saccharobesus litoralis TaxID=2172099 RepID=A0A2S0VRJ1_9ALTE|nr:glycosyltransferase family 9 protein [Saccharobesus litoralis]AWB66802.1 ADP-heptose--LPS heptosyltransferase I [Saccharobesus litoralis]
MAQAHPQYHSICILRLSAIGDVCHAVASVQAIQRTYPQAQITWVIGKVEAMLLGDLPGVKFVIFDKSQGWRAFLQLRRALPQTFDVLLHMQVALRANIAAKMIRAKHKVGFSKQLSKELHSWVVDEHINMPARPHVLEGFQAFAHAIGVPRFEARWHIPISQQDMNWALNYRQAEKPLLVIAPAASKAERNWLAERYAQLAEHAVAKGFQVILTGGPSEMEKALAKAIESFCSADVLNLVGQSHLKQLLAMLNVADVVVAPDTGPAHMAVTQGTPVIGLYAHSNPARTGPYTWQSYVVEVYQQHVVQQHGLPVEQLAWGTRVKGQDLMADISVQRVVDMFDKVTEEHGLLIKNTQTMAENLI